MAHTPLLLPFFALLTVPLQLHAASAPSPEQEYEQVRRIALRDAKVRGAYADADRKLEAKILQIDPALESYLRHRPAGGSVSPAPTASRPVEKSATSVPPHPFRHAHVVVKGDTLGSIALKYGVTVGALKETNRVSDEKNLAVGQVLAIPEPKAGH